MKEKQVIELHGSHYPTVVEKLNGLLKKGWEVVGFSYINGVWKVEFERQIPDPTADDLYKDESMFQGSDEAEGNI